MRLPVKQLRFRVMNGAATAATARRGGRSECHPAKGKTCKVTNQQAETEVASRDGQGGGSEGEATIINPFYLPRLCLLLTPFILWFNFAC